MLISIPIILVAEVFCLLLVVSLVYAFLVWRKRNRLVTALDQLTGDAAENEPARLESLKDKLESFCDADSQHAENLSGEFSRAEKSFLQDMVALLLGNRHEDVAGLNARIYSLTGHYIDALIELRPSEPADSSGDDVSEPGKKNKDDAVQSSEQKDNNDENTDKVDTSETDDPLDTENADEEAVSEQADVEISTDQPDDSGSVLAETTTQDPTPTEDGDQPQAKDSEPDETSDASVNSKEADDASETITVEDTGTGEDVLAELGKIEISLGQKDDAESDPPKNESATDADADTEDNPATNDEVLQTA